MLPQSTYRQFVTDLVRRHITLFGPILAVDTVNRVEGIEIDPNGVILQLQGNPVLIIESIIHEFQKLSPQVTNAVVTMQLEQYPDIKRELTQALPHVKLVCPLIVPRV